MSKSNKNIDYDIIVKISHEINEEITLLKRLSRPRQCITGNVFILVQPS